MGPTPMYGAGAEKPLQIADFAMKQTNICCLSGDKNICKTYTHQPPTGRRLRKKTRHARTYTLLFISTQSYICLSDTVNSLLTYLMLPCGESIQIDWCWIWSYCGQTLWYHWTLGCGKLHGKQGPGFGWLDRPWSTQAETYVGLKCLSKSLSCGALSCIDIVQGGPKK